MVHGDHWYWGDLHKDQNIDGNTFYFNATSEVGQHTDDISYNPAIHRFTVRPDAFVQRVDKVFVISEGGITYNEAFEKFNAEWNK